MDLFEKLQSGKRKIVKDAYLLPEFALPNQDDLLVDIRKVIATVPLRQMVTPGGFKMSVAMTNCGNLGWVSDRKGYRYVEYDPLNEKPWPMMPASFLQLANVAASNAGFNNFVPDACLVNQYAVGARMNLHQDKNELDYTWPIVSVSLGLPAMFQFGGFKRVDKVIKIQLNHGDVVVWGGESRLRFHGILPLKAGVHQLFGESRINLTFRKAG